MRDASPATVATALLAAGLLLFGGPRSARAQAPSPSAPAAAAPAAPAPPPPPSMDGAKDGPGAGPAMDGKVRPPGGVGPSLAGTAPAAPPLPERYVRVSADDAAGNMQNAFWAFTVGALVHGTGSYLAGDEQLALTLLGMEAAGLLLWAGGLAGERTSHDSARIVPYTRPVQALGALAFVSSWQLDLLSTFTGRAGTTRYEPAPPDPVVGTVFYTLWSDPRQGHLNLFTVGLDLPAGRLARLLDRLDLGADAVWDPFSTSTPLLLNGRAGLRLLGAKGELASRLSLDLEWDEEWRDDQGYRVSTPLASLEGRFDLQRVLPRLHNVVLLGRWGYGLEVLRYGDPPSSWSLAGDRSWVTVGEMGIILPLVRVGRMDLRWRLLDDRLLCAGQVGRAPYHVGFHFQISSLMDMILSLNVGTGFDGWIGLAYRYY